MNTNIETITENEVQDYIQGLLEDDFNENEDSGMRVVTFAAAGVLSYNRGLILTTDDGKKYNITITEG